MRFDLQKISALIGIAVPPLILCSCIRLKTYYDHWDIPIFDYLSSSELLLSFLQPALIFILIFACYIGTFILLPGLVMFLYVKFKEKDDKRASKEGLTKKMKDWKFYWSIIVIAILIYVYIQSIWFDYNKIMTIVLFPLLLIGLIWLISTLIESNSYEKISIKDGIAKIQSIFIAILLILLLASFFYGRFEVNNTINSHMNYKITLSDNSSIETNDNLIYLGKTSGYYFLFNNVDKQSTILPASVVKSINIKILE